MRRLAQIAFVLLSVPFVLSGYARAAEPTVITLSCDGTVTETAGLGASADAKPQPMQKMGVVVDLNERTVSFEGFVARVTEVDAANIHFAGSLIRDTHGFSTGIGGDIDRVTGRMTARIEVSPKQPSYTVINSYDVLCKATNRVF